MLTRGGRRRECGEHGTHSVEAVEQRGTSLAIRAPPPPAPARKQPTTVTAQIDQNVSNTTQAVFHRLTLWVSGSNFLLAVKFAFSGSSALKMSRNSRHGKSSVASFSATSISSRECS